MEQIGALFHWSPATRRKQIAKYGLLPGRKPTVSSNDNGFRQPHVCLAPTPSAAWALSGGMNWTPDGEWDLYQVRLDLGDEVHIRPFWGNRVEEYQVKTRIPKSRVWYVGSRVKSRP